MSTAVSDYATLLRDAISQAKAGAPQVADDLRKCASQAAEAIATVTDGAAALDLVPLSSPDGASQAFQLVLRRVGVEGSPSDLGVLQLSEAGYPVQRWYSRGNWESNPIRFDQLHDSKSSLEGYFRWLVSNPSSRLVVLVAFIMQQTHANRSRSDTSEK
jgi:hypothetical protein